MNKNRFERGQALIVIVLSIVALFGFAALAVDMGRIFAERRRAQSAADSAALAAAYAAANAPVDSKDAYLVGLETAEAQKSVLKNGYSTSEIKVSKPDSGNHYEECDCEYIQVTITSKVNPIFSQFVFKGTENITTKAIARGRRNTNLSEDNAIHALSHDPDALVIDGNTTVNVKGGNIRSNGGGVKNGAAGQVSAKDGKIFIAGDWSCPGCKSDTVSPKPSAHASIQTVLDVPVPYCPASNETHDGVNYYVYPTGINGSMDLKPGVHCVDNGITLNGGDKLTGNAVLIVLKSGGITINGNASVNLKRPNALIDNNSHSYNGMLIYMLAKNTSTIQLGGTSDSWISGTVFAPKGACEISGNSTDTSGKHYNASIICYTVKLNGAPVVNINYKKEENFQMQPLVELIE